MRRYRGLSGVGRTNSTAGEITEKSVYIKKKWQKIFHHIHSEGYLMKYLLSFTVSVLAAAILVSFMPLGGEAEIYDDVIRLHVIAESDTEEDQALKLKVRDAVLECVCGAVEECSTVDEAYTTVDALREKILEAAENCVSENGGDCTVTVELGREKYPRRDYGAATLPAGVYNSLRVTLGEGRGHNWWCVLFPSVCMRFASADEYSAVSLTPAEYRIITNTDGKTKVKFRLLEIIEEIISPFAEQK